MIAALIIMAVAGYALRWAQDRAEQRRRFERSIARFDHLNRCALRWADDPDVIDLRDPK